MADTDWTRPVIVLDGVTFTRLQSAEELSLKDKQPWESRKIVTNLIWKEDIDLLTNANVDKVFRDLGSPHAKEELCDTYISTWLSLSGHKLPSQNVLHIGGGATGLALRCLEQLGGEHGTTPFFRRYVIADPDDSNLEHARSRLGSWKETVDFKTVDLEKDLTTQEFEQGSFDVVVVEKVTQSWQVSVAS